VVHELSSHPRFRGSKRSQSQIAAPLTVQLKAVAIRNRLKRGKL